MTRDPFRKGTLGIVCILLAACASAQETAQRLTMQDAIGLALQKNLNVLVAGTQISEAEGTRTRRLSALLPHAGGDALANRKNLNLAASGISIPGAPTVVGPFSYYDFRISASQSLIDRQGYHNWKASTRQEQAAKLDYEDSRSLVIRQAAALYLDAQSAAAEVQAVESRVSTSEALEKLALDQHGQGLATAVDVVRAQVQLARDRHSVLVAQDNYQTSLLVLERYLGMSPGTALEVTEQPPFHHIAAPAIDDAVHTALQARADYRSLFSQRESIVEQQKASRARYFPTLSINGDYGALGRNFGTMPGIGQIQGTLSITVFDRDRSGERQELASRLQRLNAQIDDLARGIEQDLRKAMLDLDSTEQQVKLTEEALNLAHQELTLSEDRFRDGVADNIEVVTAQAALASAEDDRITALASHADAGVALARALGVSEKSYQAYLGGP